MDAQLWHQQATTPPPQMPEPIPIKRFEGLADFEQDAYWGEVSDAITSVVLPCEPSQHAEKGLNRLIQRISADPRGLNQSDPSAPRLLSERAPS